MSAKFFTELEHEGNYCSYHASAEELRVLTEELDGVCGNSNVTAVIPTNDTEDCDYIILFDSNHTSEEVSADLSDITKQVMITAKVGNVAAIYLYA